MSVTSDDFLRVLALRHWTGSIDGPRHTCKCEECLAIKRVVHLARQAGEMIQARKRRAAVPPGETTGE